MPRRCSPRRASPAVGSRPSPEPRPAPAGKSGGRAFFARGQQPPSCGRGWPGRRSRSGRHVPDLGESASIMGRCQPGSICQGTGASSQETSMPRGAAPAVTPSPRPWLGRVIAARLADARLLDILRTWPIMFPARPVMRSRRVQTVWRQDDRDRSNLTPWPPARPHARRAAPRSWNGLYERCACLRSGVPIDDSNRHGRRRSAAPDPRSRMPGRARRANAPGERPQ